MNLVPLPRACMLPGPDGHMFPLVRRALNPHVWQSTFMTAYIGQRYSMNVTSSGGTAPYTWSTHDRDPDPGPVG